LVLGKFGRVILENDTYILGISAFYHDSAVALIKNGEIIFAGQEERFSRIKHDASFPIQAFNAALDYAGINVSKLYAISYFEDPKLKSTRVISSYLEYFPKGLSKFADVISGVPINQKRVENEIRKLTGFSGSIIFGNHHLSHAASAFYPSPFTEAAILTMDGIGEWATGSISHGQQNRITLRAEKRFPHSLGLLYSAFTKYCGFKVNSGEYKLMGLAPYGQPKFISLIADHLAIHNGLGSIKLNMEYFDFELGNRMFNEKFENLFGAKAATAEQSTNQFFMDVAASIQLFTEEVMIGAALFAKELTGSKNLCLAGGVALNCVANGKILERNIFDNIWIQPAAGDAGGALGSALSFWYKDLSKPRIMTSVNLDAQKGSFLGKFYTDKDIEDALKEQNAAFTHYESRELLIKKVAELISQENVVGWHQGRSEFGPRALGSRSILGDPRSEKTQSTMNLKIKFRESFRPFAPAVMSNKASEWFNLKESTPSPYMLLVAKVLGKHLISHDTTNLKGIEILNVKRSTIPAVTHVDNSARIQSVHKETNEDFFNLINEFDKITGVPLVVNTSFNVRGEPIVESPKDAFICFMRSNIDYLCIGNYLLAKTDQSKFEEKLNWREVFELD
jgi:carbamoyltransferase